MQLDNSYREMLIQNYNANLDACTRNGWTPHQTGFFFASFADWGKSRDLAVPRIKGEAHINAMATGYIVGMHEMGHTNDPNLAGMILACRGIDPSYVNQSELVAWMWAIEQTPIWTPSMQAIMEYALSTYFANSTSVEDVDCCVHMINQQRGLLQWPHVSAGDLLGMASTWQSWDNDQRFEYFKGLPMEVVLCTR